MVQLSMAAEWIRLNLNTPTVVQTNILIRSMGPVSELDMEYSMDCYFRQYWRDQRLSFMGPIKSLSLSIKMLERIWRPDTYFYNGKNSYVHTITVPNKLLRISQDGDILYSMRLTIKAKCPMELRSFPMDRQSCPLIFGSCEFSVLQVSFNLQRHTGYFLIQVYVPCILIVVLSWVSFWIHREATSDRVGLGITTVLTLSTISLDSRTDLPKVRYATALDWFLLMSFFYCIATLLEFAGVHYFTKVGSGEIPVDEDDWDDCNATEEETKDVADFVDGSTKTDNTKRRRSSLICPIYNNSTILYESRKTSLTSNPQVPSTSTVRVTMDRMTQTETKLPKWKLFLYCLKGDDKFRKQREREAAVASGLGKGNQHGHMRHINSVSLIDRTARVVFPASFGFFNLFYWMAYFMLQDNFKWGDTKLSSRSH
ncbi:unnamed protein product [Acanthoscelides obtectus]|uniref:Gamma-aminobutyric acid receptor alpha-like n=1 Tax=Acanthoscelides obtectus TaxID=200917 RepID=A0A9P0NW51_ACAOB|nr:unnamed protein product [Acanthoscelides obtectus]CAK1668069.1 Gamma-aminobutyric acid receptor subunit alpha-6 [Acanthoscelides obtectus]